MYLTKIAAAAALALSLIAAPVLAKDLDVGTKELVELGEELGITFAINTSECAEKYGSFNANTMTITICKVQLTDGIADSEAHSTVRHEMFHVAQYCNAKSQGQLTFNPLMPNMAKFTRFVATGITDESIHHIVENYSEAYSAAELEAAAAEVHFNSIEIAEIVESHCKGVL